MSETCCTQLAENTGCKNDAKNRHLSTIPQLCWAIFSQLRHISTIRKKLVKQQYLLHMSVEYGELWHTSGWDRFVSFGHPANFNGFCVLAPLLHGTPVLGVSQTLRRWTEGATYIRQGGHHVGHWPGHISCCWINQSKPISTGNWARIPVREDSSVHRPKRICLHVVFTIHFTINSRSFSVAARTLDLPRQSNQHYIRLYCN